MRKGLTFLAPLAVAAVMALPSAAADTVGPDTVVARVNGETITMGHMIAAYATLPQQYQQVPPASLYPAILEQLIQQTVLKQNAPMDTPLHVQLSLDNETRSLMAAEKIEEIMASAASDNDIRAAYDAKYADGFGENEFNASHILLATQDEALAVKASLEDGADFAEMAKEKSIGPSGPGGGQLGWFTPDKMVPEFSGAVIAMEPGDLSDPIQTQFGWHVIRLNDKRRAAAPEFEAVREELANEIRVQAVDDEVVRLTGEANVERPEIDGLDANILLNLDLIRN